MSRHWIMVVLGAAATSVVICTLQYDSNQASIRCAFRPSGGVTFVLYFLLAVFFINLPWEILAYRRLLRVERGLCPKCAYDLRGSSGATACPECGAALSRMPG